MASETTLYDMPISNSECLHSVWFPNVFGWHVGKLKCLL
jgi:hypothetical protein